MDNSDKILDFIRKYRGAIIGAIIAIILVCTSLYKLLIALIIIVGFIFLGNYIQNNKEDVKERLKNIIDKF